MTTRSGDLAALSVWSALECEGGTNLGELSTMSVVVEEWDVETGWSCQVVIAPNDPSIAVVVKRNVLRVELTDGTVREYRIAEVSDGRGPSADPVTVRGQDPRIDLAEKVFLSTTGSGGVVYFDDGRADLTPDEYLDDVIVPAATAAGLGVSKGTVTPAPQLSIDWKRSTDLALLLQLLQAIRDRGVACEFDYRRNGSTDYQIDLVTAIGSSATAPELHVGVHVPRWARTQSTTDMATRVIPFGGVDGTGTEAVIAHAGWKITAKAGAVLTLEDPLGGDGPIQFPNQHADPHGDWYLQDIDGTLIQVTASSRTNATQSSVTLASTPTAAVDDVVEFRADAAGTYLTSLTHPTYIQAPPAGYGELVLQLDRPALRGERNLCPNPWMRTWPNPALPPTGYSVSYPNGTLARETATPPVNFGPYAQRLTVPANNQFYSRTDPFPVFPVAGNDQFTISLSLTAYTAGSELFVFVVDPDHSTPSSSVTYLGIYYVPAAQIPIGARFDLSIAGITCPLNATRIYVELHQSNVVSGVLGAYDLVWDAINVTQTPNAADEFFEHPRANALWQAGNNYLEQWASPPPDFDGSLLDYARLDPTWTDVAVVPGCTTRVIDQEFAIDYSIRAVHITWNRLLKGDTRVKWSSRPKPLFASGSGSLGGRALLSGGPTPTNPNAPGMQPTPVVPAPVAIANPGVLMMPFYAPGTQTTLTNLPASETERTDTNEAWALLSAYEWVRLEAVIATPASQGQLVAKYKTAPSGAWDYLDGVSGPVLDLAQSGTVKGDDVAIAASAKTDVILGLFEAGGNGTDDPVIGHVFLHLHKGAQLFSYPTALGCAIAIATAIQGNDFLGNVPGTPVIVTASDMAAYAGTRYDYSSAWPIDTDYSMDPAYIFNGHPTLRGEYGGGQFASFNSPTKIGMGWYTEFSDGGTPTETLTTHQSFWTRLRIDIADPAFETGYTGSGGRGGLELFSFGINHASIPGANGVSLFMRNGRLVLNLGEKALPFTDVDIGASTLLAGAGMRSLMTYVEPQSSSLWRIRIWITDACAESGAIAIADQTFTRINTTEDWATASWLHLVFTLFNGAGPFAINKASFEIDTSSNPYGVTT